MLWKLLNRSWKLIIDRSLARTRINGSEAFSPNSLFIYCSSLGFFLGADGRVKAVQVDIYGEGNSNETIYYFLLWCPKSINYMLIYTNCWLATCSHATLPRYLSWTLAHWNSSDQDLTSKPSSSPVKRVVSWQTALALFNPATSFT